MGYGEMGSKDCSQEVLFGCKEQRNACAMGAPHCWPPSCFPSSPSFSPSLLILLPSSRKFEPKL